MPFRKMKALNLTVRELAERIGGRVEGDGEAVVAHLASVASAEASDLTFAMSDEHEAALPASRARAAVVGPDAPAADIPLIRVPDVQAAVAAILGILGDAEDLPAAGVHPTAIVAEDAELADGVAIGPGAVIASRATIGAAAVLCAHVTVGSEAVIGDGTILLTGTAVEAGCRIGRRCRIGPHAVIGASGLGYYFADERHHRIPHAGTVEIGDDVDIGAGACVDRAKFGATRIGDGTKIDNLVQVAHNVQVGRGCVLAAQTGVAGSTRLKDHVIAGGHVGIRDHLTVGSGVTVAAYTAIAQDVPDGMTLFGIPATDAKQQLRMKQALTRLPALLRQVRQLAKRLEALEAAADHRQAR